MALRRTSQIFVRLRQTFTLFTNGPEVLLSTALAKTRWGKSEITYRLRNGLVVVTSNSNGARFPVYEVFSDDAYDLEELFDGLPESPVVLDIGGQIGAFSMAVATRYPQASVHVYEASPTSCEFIRRNIDANHLQGRITLHNRALAGRRGRIDFLDSGTASGHNGITAPEWIGATAVQVEAESFDDAVASVGVPVDLVKIDVEGSEYDIVLNSDPESWRSVQRVVMEYHPVDGRRLDELIGFFGGAGLVPSRHVEGTRAGLGLLWLSRDDAATT